MDDGALRIALQQLLAQGEQAEDSKLTRMAAAKNVPPPAAPEACPQCQKPMAEGKCLECGYEAQGEDEGELASLLEQGAQEA